MNNILRSEMCVELNTDFENNFITLISISSNTDLIFAQLLDLVFGKNTSKTVNCYWSFYTVLYK